MPPTNLLYGELLPERPPRLDPQDRGGQGPRQRVLPDEPLPRRGHAGLGCLCGGRGGGGGGAHTRARARVV